MVELESGRLAWDNPRMKLVSDNRCRVQSQDLFKPNTPYEASAEPDGSIRLAELVEKEAPLVRARKVKGRWVGAAIKLDREAVVKAIKRDRESR